MKPRISIVIPVRNQAARLRLTLLALTRQSSVDLRACEVLVVDDGSSDDIDQALAAAEGRGLGALVIRCESHGGRGLPRNLGAQAARGEILVFLDADACPGETLLLRHLSTQRKEASLAVGEIFVVPGTYSLLDPTTGATFPQADRSSAWPLLRVAEDQWEPGVEDFFLRHAEKGGYPGQTTWHSQLEEMLLAGDETLAWIGVIPHNLSVPRADFVRIGGFDPFLQHSEGWELGVRAQKAGLPIRLAIGARSFHLHHWRPRGRDVRNIQATQRLICARYPDQGLHAASVWFAASMGTPFIPAELNLQNWRIVAEASRNERGRRMLARLGEGLMMSGRGVTLLDYLDGSALNAPFSAVAPPGARRTL